MNIWLGLITVLFNLIAGVAIYIKYKQFGKCKWNIFLLITASIAFWVGENSKVLWQILLCSIVVGGSLLLAVVQSYNKLIGNGKVYESIGEATRPKPFGNGYWK